MTHPARFSPQIIDALRPILANAEHVHDCFAGTGERLGALCDELGVTFSGTEIEAPFIVNPMVGVGDSRNAETYPHSWSWWGDHPYWIVTSPSYANGMNDNFRPADTSKRYTYRAALIEATGNPDATLTDGNTGAHSYRSGRKAAERYWQLNREVVAQWGHAERVIVNVSDFYMKDKRICIGRGWMELLIDHGWHIDCVTSVKTPRMRNGANSGRRVDSEAIIEAVKA